MIFLQMSTPSVWVFIRVCAFMWEKCFAHSSLELPKLQNSNLNRGGGVGMNSYINRTSKILERAYA